MFLQSIQIKEDIILESNRPLSQKRFFKIKTKTRKEKDYRTPIYTGDFRRQQYAIKTIKERTFVIHKKDYQLNFENITVIVGDNGCGKSHLISYLEPKFNSHFYFNEDQRMAAIKNWINNEEYKLIFIKNPQHIVFSNEIHKNCIIDNLKNSKPTLSGPELSALFDMSEGSNGENVLDFIESLTGITDSIIILDEPETSLSIKSQGIIKKQIQQLAKNNQIILITHSPILMELTERVYDFEKLMYCNTKEYIKNQLI